MLVCASGFCAVEKFHQTCLRMKRSREIKHASSLEPQGSVEPEPRLSVTQNQGSVYQNQGSVYQNHG
ncbi:unnamed protein product [Gadus morhua 'NCC']